MADKEMYDYLSTVTPTYTATILSVTPQMVLPATGKKSQVLHEFDDGSIGVISKSSSSYFDVSLQWDILISSDAGIIMDFWHDTNKANGMENSFYWQHPADGHTYVAHFMGPLTTVYTQGRGADYKEVQQIELRIIGRKADS
jgi:hypothetical protein